jgi:hypothetical protein
MIGGSVVSKESNQNISPFSVLVLLILFWRQVPWSTSKPTYNTFIAQEWKEDQQQIVLKAWKTSLLSEVGFVTVCSNRAAFSLSIQTVML